MTRTSQLPQVILTHQDGCKLANSCLNCHIPYCPHDPSMKWTRNNEIKQRWQHGSSFKELAAAYYLKESTVRSIVCQT